MTASQHRWESLSTARFTQPIPNHGRGNLAKPPGAGNGWTCLWRDALARFEAASGLRGRRCRPLDSRGQLHAALQRGLADGGSQVRDRFRRDGFVQVVKKAMETRVGSSSDEVLKVLAKQGIPRTLAKEALEVARTHGAFIIFAVAQAYGNDVNTGNTSRRAVFGPGTHRSRRRNVASRTQLPEKHWWTSRSPACIKKCHALLRFPIRPRQCASARRLDYSLAGERLAYTGRYSPVRPLEEVTTMQRKLSWLHLSDLHIRSGEQYDQTVALNSLISDVRQLVMEQDANFDMVFLTGDLAFSGHSDEYSVVQEFIHDLSSAAAVPLDRIFCVPGNHDVDRSQVTPFRVNVARALTSRELVSQLLGTRDELSLFTKRHHSYYEAMRATFPWAQSISHSDLSFTLNMKIQGIRTTLVGLNSAWIAGSDTDKGALVLGERQVREALDKADAPDIVIALMHHPFSYLTDFDAADVQALLNARCDFLLHGHLHALGVVNIASPDSEVFHLAAGATYQGRTELLSYNYVTADLSSGMAQVSVRRYSDREDGFWVPDTTMYRAAPNGTINITLPERLTHEPQEPDIVQLRERLTALVPETAPPEAQPECVPAVPSPPPTLIKSITRGQCILFAGAGSSIDAKLPGWIELLRGMIERTVESGVVSRPQQDQLHRLLDCGDYLVVAAFCRDQLGKYEFAQFLQERLSDVNRQSRTHRLLASIPFRAAVTTNFDSFIENYRSRVRVVLPDMMERLGAAGVESLLSDRSTFPIVKMHGSASDVDSIVLTRGDFRRLLFAKPKYREFLQRLFTDATIFFYGYSFRDPNVDVVLQQLTSLYEGMSRPHYALLPDPGDIAKRYLFEDMNIRVIPYQVWDGAHVAATAFLQSLVQKCDAGTSSDGVGSGA